MNRLRLYLLAVPLTAVTFFTHGCLSILGDDYYIEDPPTGGGDGGSSTGGTVGVGGIGGTGGTAGVGGIGGTGGSAPTKLSCATLPDTCGPGGNEDCCESPVVPGGSYLRSYDNVDFKDDSNPATVSAFALDRFEVTVGRFRAYVDAGKGTQASPPAASDGQHPKIGAGSGWDSSWDTELPVDTNALKAALNCDATCQTWTDTAGGNERLPINCVTWYDAFAFCAWDGGRLPTEAEWNYAAAGGDEHRYYPWSKPPNPTTIDNTYAVYGCMIDGSAGCAFSDIQRVGSRSPKGDGRWLHADLAGSMWEWDLDWYGPYPKPCNDCANLTTASNRVGRGGNWGYLATDLRAAGRGSSTPTGRNYNIGFRCSRTP